MMASASGPQPSNSFMISSTEDGTTHGALAGRSVAPMGMSWFAENITTLIW